MPQDSDLHRKRGVYCSVRNTWYGFLTTRIVRISMYISAVTASVVLIGGAVTVLGIIAAVVSEWAVCRACGLIASHLDS